MKYATLGPQHVILSVFDTLPSVEHIEISDEIAATVRSGRAAKPPIIYIYEDGKLLTLRQKLARLKPMVAEQWIEKQGYTALKVIALMDAENKLAAAGKTSSKLSAVRSWLDSVTSAHVMNPEPKTDWPDAPFTFEQTMQEAASVILNP